MTYPPITYLLALAASLVASLATSGALVISEGEIYGKGASTNPPLQQQQQQEFPLSGNSVMINQGSGVYLGLGWVLTSTHVGCAPVTFSNGSTFSPQPNSWKILESHSGKPSDIAIFRLAEWEHSKFLRQLPPVRISHTAPAAGDRIVLAATGYVQSGERKALTLHGEKIATQGVYLKQQRAFLFGYTTIARVPDTLVKTKGGLETASFMTRFGREPGEAQATAGDSGGAAFRFNEATQEWEIVGIIFAVSHRARFVPYNAKTFVGALTEYQPQLSALAGAHPPIATNEPVPDFKG